MYKFRLYHIKVTLIGLVGHYVQDEEYVRASSPEGAILAAYNLFCHEGEQLISMEVMPA